jgi:SAM-dependent methyltransferase
MYNEHLNRISNRPGESLQVKLVKGIFDKFLDIVANLNRNSGSTFELKGKRLLEVGCGSGRLLPIVVSKGLHYSAFEPTESMRKALLNTATRSAIPLDSFEVLNQSLPEIPPVYFDNFDFGVAMHVIEHAPNPFEAYKWILSFSQCINVGGYFLIVTPHYPDYSWRFYDVDWSHGFPTTLNNLVEILEDLGLEVKFSKTIRGWTSSRVIGVLCWTFLKISPTGFLDFLCEKLFRQKLLYSGLLAGFVRRNTFIVVQKVKVHPQ